MARISFCFLVSLSNHYASSFTILVTASCSCWTLTIVLPSCLVKTTITEAIFLLCFLSTLPSPPWQACLLAIIHYIRCQLLVLSLSDLHIYVFPLSVAVSYCPLLCYEHKHDIVLFHFLHEHLSTFFLSWLIPWYISENCQPIEAGCTGNYLFAYLKIIQKV